AGNLFTTHTPAAAGFDRFSPALMHLYLNWYATDRLNISFEDLMAMGRVHHDDQSEPFSMAYLAARGAGAINGVSRLHGAVSRSIFAPLYPRWPLEEIPVGSVTNGVHTASWESELSEGMWSQAAGKDRWRGAIESIGDRIRTIADDRLWALRTNSRQELVLFLRRRTDRQMASYGAAPE